MSRSILSTVITAALIAASQTGSASDVTIPNTFVTGTPAVAAQVNANFSAVEAAVDDNYARILTLQSSPSFTGNLTLVPSTATSGNIMKGTNRFLHDYGGTNVFLGLNAGNFTMTGLGYNTAIGRYTLQANITGESNTACGAGALQANTTGSYNTASGLAALEGNTDGVNNTASGYTALQTNTSGVSNTANGAGALQFNTAGSSNTAIGFRALRNSTGSSNIAIGNFAGLSLTTGSNNIAIDNYGVAAESSTIRIGDTQTRAFISGIRGVTTATAAIPVLIGTDGQLGTTSSSRRVKDHIANMGQASSVLMQLRPVTFHYKADQNPKGRALQYGLVAEEVAQVAPHLVAHSANGEIETVYYQHLTPMLLNEYQKQQRTIAAQQALLTQQTARIATLEKQAQELAELKAQMARMTAVLSRLQGPERVAATGRQ